MQYDETIHTAVDALALSLQARAYRLNRPSIAALPHEKRLWIARGKQEALRSAARCLATLGQACAADPRKLYAQIQAYLGCVQTSMGDALEEASGRSKRSCIEQWKALGETQELGRVEKAVSRLLCRWQILAEPDVLLSRGQVLVPFEIGEPDLSAACYVLCATAFPVAYPRETLATAIPVSTLN
jgi:hypothetical protein